MPKYRVDLETGAGCSVVVEAEDPDAAVDAAMDLAPSGVCAQCSGWGEAYSLDLGEWEPSGDGSTTDCVEELS